MKTFLILLCFALQAQGQLGLSDPVFVSRLNQLGGAAATGPFGGLVDTNLIRAYWRLDESSAGSGATARNTVIGTNHLTDNSPFAASGTGKIADGLVLIRANSEYLSVADGPDLSMGTNVNLTITAWAKLYSKPAGGSMFIISKDVSSSGTREFDMSYDTATDRFRFHIGRSLSPTLDTVSCTNIGAISTNVWYFVVGTWDTSANVMKISVNDGTPDSLGKTIDAPNSTSAVEVGRFGTAVNYWDGEIDEIGIWKRVLSAAEITALYGSGSGLTY